MVFHENLGFILFFMLTSFYRRLVCHRFIDVILFVILLRHFIYVGAIQTSKTYLIGQRYKIMIVNTLKNWSCRYSSRYFIKFISFISIYYTINLNIVSSYIVFNYLYLGSIDLL